MQATVQEMKKKDKSGQFISLDYTIYLNGK